MVVKGDLRLAYRFKESRQFSDERRIHARAACFALLPLGTRIEDLRKLLELQGTVPAEDVIAYETLGNIYQANRTDPSSSSGAGVPAVVPG